MIAMIILYFPLIGLTYFEYKNIYYYNVMFYIQDNTKYVSSFDLS